MLHLKRHFSKHKSFASAGAVELQSKGCDLVEPPSWTSGAGSNLPTELSNSPHTFCTGELG